MEYYKLLEDFLNKDLIIKEFKVFEYMDEGSSIRVIYKRDGNDFKDETIVFLFELLTFVYSKV